MDDCLSKIWSFISTVTAYSPDKGQVPSYPYSRSWKRSRIRRLSRAARPKTRYFSPFHQQPDYAPRPPVPLGEYPAGPSVDTLRSSLRGFPQGFLSEQHIQALVLGCVLVSCLLVHAIQRKQAILSAVTLLVLTSTGEL